MFRCILLLAVLLESHRTFGQQILFDTIVSFGDSSTDTGNVYNLTNGRWPPSIYYRGHFSNGPVWVEKLAVANLINYAYGSATSDNDLVQGYTDNETLVPGARQQISTYIRDFNSTKIGFDRTLYIVWAGGNDYFFLNFNVTPSTVVTRLLNGVNDLSNIGAKYILMINQPPMQAYPAARPLNADSILSELTRQHNANLSASIEALQLNLPNVSLQVFDVYTLINSIIANGSSLGLNTVDGCWDNITVPCSNPSTYVYIDGFHFTTSIHQKIADATHKFLWSSSAMTNSLPCSILLVFTLAYLANH